MKRKIAKIWLFIVFSFILYVLIDLALVSEIARNILIFSTIAAAVIISVLKALETLDLI